MFLAKVLSIILNNVLNLYSKCFIIDSHPSSTWPQEHNELGNKALFYAVKDEETRGTERINDVSKVYSGSSAIELK